jgi:hypothetical protein
MPRWNEPLAIHQPVVDQASEVAAAAVRAALADALRQAEVCKCHRCRVQAGQIASWAAGVLESQQPAIGRYGWLSHG